MRSEHRLVYTRIKMQNAVAEICKGNFTFDYACYPNLKSEK